MTYNFAMSFINTIALYLITKQTKYEKYKFKLIIVRPIHPNSVYFS